MVSLDELTPGTITVPTSSMLPRIHPALAQTILRRTPR